MQYVKTTPQGHAAAGRLPKAAQRAILAICERETHIYDLVEAVRTSRHTYLMETFVIETVLTLQKQGYVDVA